MSRPRRVYDYHLHRGAACLAAGGVLVHATEAVFGLAARACDRAACARVAALKQRPGGKAFIVIGASTAQLAPLVLLDTPCAAAIEASWPGPHTWILRATPHCPDWLAGRDGRVAVRVTAHAQAARLCLHAGPLISTSANPAGRAPARRLLDARRYFGPAVDCYLPGRLGGARRPSTIRDGASGRIIRS